jgi:hypothetical protein
MSIYQSILDNIEKTHERHSDTLVWPQDLVAYPHDKEITCYFASESDGDFTFVTHAMDQLLNRLGIPVQFYQKNPSNLQSAMFNFWNSRRKDPYLFRMRDENIVRAVLTEKYGVMDDIDVLPVVIQELKNDTTSPRWLHRDDQITQLAINFDELQTKFEGDGYQAGMVVSNSETGYSSVWIEPVIFSGQYSFYNRTALLKEGMHLRMVHRGRVDTERLKPMIAQSKEAAQVGIVQLLEASQETISGNYAINFVRATDALSKRFKDILEEEWKEEEYITKLNASRRILECASELPLFQKLTVEQQVGKLTGLFVGYKSRWQGITQELEDLNGL